MFYLLLNVQFNVLTIPINGLRNLAPHGLNTDYN